MSIAVMMVVMERALLLLHGFTHTGSSWDGVLGALPQRYRALAPDLRGHGSASERVPVTLDAVLGDLAGLLDGPVTVVGYSMGGRIALHLALAAPERVTRLVLIGASPGLAEPQQRRERIAADDRLAAELERMTIDDFAARWAQTPVLADAPAAVRERAHADRLRSTPPGLARALRGLGTGTLPSLWGRLGELSLPVDLAVGERDHKFRAIADEMAGALAHGRVTVVPGAGHAAHLEAPRAIAALIAGAQGASPR